MTSSHVLSFAARIRLAITYMSFSPDALWKVSHATDGRLIFHQGQAQICLLYSRRVQYAISKEPNLGEVVGQTGLRMQRSCSEEVFDLLHGALGLSIGLAPPPTHTHAGEFSVTATNTPSPASQPIFWMAASVNARSDPS